MSFEEIDDEFRTVGRLLGDLETKQASLFDTIKTARTPFGKIVGRIALASVNSDYSEAEQRLDLLNQVYPIEERLGMVLPIKEAER